MTLAEELIDTTVDTYAERTWIPKSTISGAMERAVGDIFDGSTI
jgi:hypothetical protein